MEKVIYNNEEYNVESIHVYDEYIKIYKGILLDDIESVISVNIKDVFFNVKDEVTISKKEYDALKRDSDDLKKVILITKNTNEHKQSNTTLRV